MARLSLAGFKDPVRRPRYIVWTGVFLLVIFAFMVVAIGATSTRWFCAYSCHKVQDDVIAAYESGTHAQVSCLACHEPVNANALTFMLLKGSAMVELYHTVMNTFHFPLNPGSALALTRDEMPASQCTQCHSSNRVVIPRPGLIIDHKAHADKGIWCTACHNRVAHPETGITLSLKAPDGAANSKHASFMRMTACFRCHDLQGKKDAPGICSTCHEPGWTMEPPSHADPSWETTLHTKVYQSDQASITAAAKVAEDLIAEGVEKRLAEPVAYCYTCHIKAEFCDLCHGMQVPHMADFAKRAHVAVATTKLDKCIMCHGPVKGFCDSCHHGTRIGWKYDRKVPWLQQHGSAVAKLGTAGCYKLCHNLDYCYGCHARGKSFSVVK